MTEIEMIGAVGEEFDGFTEQDIARQLTGAGDITVRINSPGGYAYTGVGIYNRLNSHAGSVRVEVLGMAASAASVIAMAGSEVLMARGSQIMIHEAWGIEVGNWQDMDKAARALRSYNESLAEIYSAKTGISVAEILDMMAKETYMTADEAIDLGFADGRLEVDSAATPDAKKVAAAIKKERKAIATASELAMKMAKQSAVINSGRIKLARMRGAR